MPASCLHEHACRGLQATQPVAVWLKGGAQQHLPSAHRPEQGHKHPHTGALWQPSP